MDPYTTIKGTSTAEITEKKSRFIGQAAHVESEEEALSFLEKTRSEHRMARHNVYAYVLREGGRIRYSDDGEPQKTAGLPVLEAIQHAGLHDVIIVVTRYFGGTLLGTGGLVRAYTLAAKSALDAADSTVMSCCVELTLHIPYTLYEQVLRLAEQAGAKVVESDFAEKVDLKVLVPDTESQTLIEKLTELTRGKAGIMVGEPFVTAF